MLQLFVRPCSASESSLTCNATPKACGSRAGRAASNAWFWTRPRGRLREHVFLHGGHVAHFQPKGERPVLWVSAREPLRARQRDPRRRAGVLSLVRAEGGSLEAPMHGFARILPWALSRRRPSLTAARGEARADGRGSGAGPLPARAQREAHAHRGPRPALTLTVRNAGSLPPASRRRSTPTSPSPTCAGVRRPRARRVVLLDKTAGWRASPERARTRSRSPPRPTASTSTPRPTVTIEDPGWGRRIVVSKSGSRHDGPLEPMGREGARDARTSATTSGPACCASRPASTLP